MPAGHHLGGQLAVSVIVEQDGEPVGFGLEHQPGAPLVVRDALAGLFSPGERVTHHQWGPRLVLEAEADRLTVLFDEYGYRELATQVVSGRHLLAPA